MARELLVAAVNFVMVPDEPGDPTAGGLSPMGEVCLVFTEPAYRIDGGGGVVKSREPGQFRFDAGREVLRQLIGQMGAWAATMDEMAAEFGSESSSKGEPNPAD